MTGLSTPQARDQQRSLSLVRTAQRLRACRRAWAQGRLRTRSGTLAAPAPQIFTSGALYEFPGGVESLGHLLRRNWAWPPHAPSCPLCTRERGWEGPRWSEPGWVEAVGRTDFSLPGFTSSLALSGCPGACRGFLGARTAALPPPPPPRIVFPPWRSHLSKGLEGWRW